MGVALSDHWWLLLPTLYLGMSLGLIAGHYAEADHPPLVFVDVLVMFLVGPFIATWLCATHLIRSRRR